MMAKRSSRSTRSREERLRGVKFDGPVAMASYAKFLKDVGAFLDDESRKFYGRRTKIEKATTVTTAHRTFPREG
jgi:hypothetical protein